MIDHVLPPGAHILSRQGCAGDRKAGPERDHEEGDRETDGNGGHRRATQSPDPKRIGQLVSGLQYVAENDGNREPEQRRPDRPLEKQLPSVFRHVAQEVLAIFGCAVASKIETPQSGDCGVFDLVAGTPNHRNRHSLIVAIR